MPDGPRPEFDKLRDLGLAEGDLAEAVRTGYLAASNCTEHHPKSAPSLIAYFEVVRTLRDIHVPAGWKASSARGYETLVSPNRSIAVAVAAGDENTGKQPPANPRTRTNKGPLTRAALVSTRFGRIFDEISPEFARTAPRRVATLILLHHLDRQEDELRLELSTPAEMDDEGYIIAWDERIILQPLIARFNLPPDEPDEPDSYDIPVPPRE